MPQEAGEDTVQPAPMIQKAHRKDGVGGTPVTKPVKGGGRGGRRGSGPRKAQPAKGAGKKGKDGSNRGNDEGTGGGEEEAAGTGVRVTRRTKQVKCASRFQ